MILKIIKFKLKVILFLLVALITLAIGIYFYSRDLNKFKPDILSFVNSQIEGNLTLGELEWVFKEEHLGFKTDLIKILDEKQNLILEANNAELIFKWKSPLYGFKKLESANMDSLYLSISKDKEGVWNYEKVLKLDPKKRGGFIISRLSVPKCKFQMLDESTNTKLAYDNLGLEWQKGLGEFSGKEFRKNIFVRIQSHNDIVYKRPKLDKEGKPDLSTLDESSKLAKVTKDYFQITGFLDSQRRWSKLKADLFVDIFNLDLKDFRPILEDLGLSEDIAGMLNSNFTLKKSAKKDMEALGFVNVKKAFYSSYDFRNIDLDIDFRLGDKNIRFDTLAFNLDGIKGSIGGKIAKWRKKKPQIEAKLTTDKFDFRRAIVVLPEGILDSNFARKLFRLGYGLASLDISLVGDLLKPKITGDINLKDFILKTKTSQLVRDVDLVVNLGEDRISIKEFKVPISHTNIKVSGWVANDREEYDFKLDTTDLSLRKFMELVVNSNISDLFDYTASFILDGYATMDLQLVKKKNEQLKVFGKSKFGKTSFYSKKYGLSLKNIYGNVKFDNNTITVDHLLGYLKDDYFEIIGSVLLDKVPKLDLKFATKKLNLQSLLEAEVLDAPFMKDLNLTGNLKDTRIDLTGGPGNLVYSAKATLEGVNVEFLDETPNLDNINGSLELKNNFLDLSDLSLFISESELKLDGTFLDPKNPKSYSVKTDKLAVDDLFALHKKLNSIVKLENADNSKSENKLLDSISNPAGDLSISLDVLEDSPKGALILNAAKFDYPYKDASLMFRNLGGQIEFAPRALNFKEFTGTLFGSDFKLNGLLENFSNKAAKPSWDMKIEGNFLASEIMPYMGPKFQRLFKIEGSFPLSLSIKGDKTRTELMAETKLSDIDKFGFHNWLLRDKSVKVAGKSRFIITPQSIVSVSSKLKFKKASETAKLWSYFQIKNWQSKENMSFYLGFALPSTKRVNLVTPHILPLIPFKLDIDEGDFKCNTFGNNTKQETFCNFYVDSGVAKKYGIGDLNCEIVSIDLLAGTGEPTETYFNVFGGDWNGIPYQDMEFDLTVDKKMVYINDLKATVGEFGKAWAEIEFDQSDLSSKFNISGQNVPAHEVAEGVWGYGAEVPSGTVSGVFNGTTKGILPVPMFENLVGETNIIIRDGKLSTLKTLQKYLSAVNAFDQGLFGIDVHNVMQTLVTYQGGQFDHIVSSLQYNKGAMSSKKLLLKAEQIELDIKGFVDYIGDRLAISGQGIIPKRPRSILGGLFGGQKPDEKVDLTDIEKRKSFTFNMAGRVYDEKEAVQSLKDNFKLY